MAITQLYPSSNASSGFGLTVPTKVELVTRWSKKRCITLHAAVVLLGIIFYQLASPGYVLIFTGIVVAFFFFLMVWVESKKSSLKVSPISAYFLWQGFALGIAAVYAGLLIKDGSSLPFGAHPLPPQYVALGYVIGLLGTLPLHAGMQMFRPVSFVGITPELTQKEANLFFPRIMFFFALGFIVLRFPRVFGFLGIISSSFEYAAHAALVAFALLPAEKLKMSEAMRSLCLIVGTGLLFLAATGSGSKLYLMLSSIGLFVYVAQSRRMRTHLPAISFLLIFVYLTVIAPVVSNARRIQVNYGVSATVALLESFKIHSPLFTGKFDVDFYREQAEILFKRQFESSSIAFIAQDVEVRGHLDGETYYQMRYAFVPRILWPDKPWVVRGGWFTSYTGASARETASTSSIGMEAAGELYWNFGYVGVVGGMFILGALFGKLWALAGPNPRYELVRLSLYMQVSLTMMNLPEAGSRVVSCIGLFMIYGAMIYLLRPPKDSRRLTFKRQRMVTTELN